MKKKELEKVFEEETKIQPKQGSNDDESSKKNSGKFKPNKQNHPPE